MTKNEADIHHSLDILIIGGGGAAALAALEARKAGLIVGVVTKESSLVGGATIMSAGGTSARFSKGDTTDVFFSDIMKAGGGINNEKLVRIVAEHSANALFGLEKYHFVLDKLDEKTLRTIKQGEGHAFPRGYLDRREALGFCHALSRELVRTKVRIFPERVISKIFAKDNRVTGAFGMNITNGTYEVFSAKAIILATGGLGALYKVTTNSSVLTGDGYALAWDIGAELIDMEMVQFFPVAFPYPEMRRGKMIGMCSHFGDGVKLYNHLNERYMDRYDAERMEMSTRDIVARANYIEILEGRGTGNGAIIVDPTDHDPKILERFQTKIPHIFKMFKDVYGEEVAEWREPFEAMPSQHFFMGGVKIDEECKTNISGLFAVGEVSGGVHGANRLSGVALTELFVFGSVAGRNAGRFAASIKEETVDADEIDNEKDRVNSLMKNGKGIRPFEIKARIQDLMWETMGPVRDGSGMGRATRELEEIQTLQQEEMAVGSEDLDYNRDRMEAIELPMMIQTARLVAQAGMYREESRGSHYRKDFPKTNDTDWRKNVVLKRSGPEDTRIRTENIVREK